MTTGANPGLIKTYAAGGAIAAYRIVKFHTADFTVVQAAAVGDKLLGVTGPLGAASGEDIDVTRTGIAQVEFGGAVTRGDQLTTDANGKAVAAAPGAGVNNSIIGIAEMSGVDGDIGAVLITPSTLQG